MSDNLPVKTGPAPAIPGLSAGVSRSISTEAGGGYDFPLDVKIKGAKVQFELTRDIPDPKNEGEYLSTFVDSLERITPLAVASQRSYFPRQMEAEPKPYCSSPNGVIGFPRENFDWNLQPGHTKLEMAVPCQNCKAAEWEGKTPPPCKEAFRLIFLTDDGRLRNIRLQGANFARTRDWLRTYQDEGRPPYSQEATLTLEGMSRGSVDYAVVKFERGEMIPEEEWPAYQETGMHWLNTYEGWRPEGYEDDPLIAEAEIIS